MKSPKEVSPPIGIEGLFAYYQSLHPDGVNYFTFTEVIRRFNKRVVEACLDGGVFYFGHRLGYLCIKQIERDHSRPSINWAETNKLKKEGVNQWVYFTDDYWYTWYWAKYRCYVVNRTVYRFEPTSGPNGIARKLSNRIKSDPFAILAYRDNGTQY